MGVWRSGTGHPAAQRQRIRERCDADLSRPGLSRDNVLAAVVRLLAVTLILVGNDEYARLNRSFGLTTLRARHAQVTGTPVRFRFRGKSGQRVEVGLRNRPLARVVRRCQELPARTCSSTSATTASRTMSLPTT